MSEQLSPSEIDHHYAGAFLVTDSGKIVGQRRDNKPNIDNPNRIGSFGGTVEAGESPDRAVWRELVEEETNLRPEPKDIHLYFEGTAWRELTNEWQVLYLYYARISDHDLRSLRVYEGQGWTYIDSPDDELLVDLLREPVRWLIELLKSEAAAPHELR